MSVGVCVDQLGVDAELIARPPDAALQYVVDSKFSADLLRVNRPVTIGERGIAGDYEQICDARQITCHVICDGVGEILLLPILAEIGKGQHDD
jgi:hypothetical protein